MATHSSILAWEIPWTEEPARLHSPWGHKELDTTERLKGRALPGWKGDRIPSAASFDHRAFL